MLMPSSKLQARGAVRCSLTFQLAVFFILGFLQLDQLLGGLIQRNDASILRDGKALFSVMRLSQQT